MYKLTYFNVRARAEPIRFIFALKEIPYEDHRIEREDWPQLKKIPALEVKGKGVLLQSIAITRYLAKKYQLTGADDFEEARCDEYVNALEDLRVDWKKYFAENDEVKKSENKRALLNIHFPKYFGKFEQIKLENGGEFLVGNQLTWTDLLMATTLQFYQDTVDPDFVNGYPALMKLQAIVFGIPQIKNWISERPVSTR